MSDYLKYTPKCCDTCTPVLDECDSGRWFMHSHYKLNGCTASEYKVAVTQARADEQKRIMSIVIRCIADNVHNISEGISLLNEIKKELEEQK